MHRYRTRIVGLMAVLAFTGFAPGVRAEDAKADATRASLAGEWEQTFVERDGSRKLLSEAKLKHARATVTFDPSGAATFRMELVPVEGKTKIEVIEMKYEVDVTKTPNEIDFIMMREGKELRTKGIFKRDKNELVLALDSHDGRGLRPKEFKTQQGDGFDIVTLVTLKPAKEEKKDDKKAD